MKPNNLKFIILTILSILVSCQKDDKAPPELIIGKWEWIRTIIPYGGQESNPQTSGFSITFEFMSNSIMKEYKNNSIINTSDYRIERNPSNPDDNILHSTIITSHFYMLNDSLIFNEAYVDGPVSTYKRKK